MVFLGSFLDPIDLIHQTMSVHAHQLDPNPQSPYRVVFQPSDSVQHVLLLGSYLDSYLGRNPHLDIQDMPSDVLQSLVL